MPNGRGRGGGGSGGGGSGSGGSGGGSGSSGDRRGSFVEERRSRRARFTRESFLREVGAMPIGGLASRLVLGMDIGGTSPRKEFFSACSKGDLPALKKAMDSMDEDDLELLTSLRMEGVGALHIAVGSGKIDVCKYLVEELGFDITEANRHPGLTPLSCAVMSGQEIAVRYLLDKGADPNKKDARGSAPLHEAAKRGHVGISQLLLSKGASVDASSYEGTPLYIAASNGKSSIVQILLEHSADPNKLSTDLWAPMAAVLYATPQRMSESECLKCLKLLVKVGADFNYSIPETPLAIATRKGLTKCAGYLSEVATGANIPSNHDKGSDKDRKSQLKLHGEKAVESKDYAGATKFYTEEKGSDKDRKTQLKLHGEKAVEAKDYAGATIFYTEAIELDPADATMFSNRSLCHLKSGRAQDALMDANACIRLKPEWPKGHYRKGAALMSLKDYKEACTAFLAGSKLDPLNDDMQNAFWEAAAAMKEEFMAARRTGSVD